jgi:hypothetical protein
LERENLHKKDSIGYLSTSFWQGIIPSQARDSFLRLNRDDSKGMVKKRMAKIFPISDTYSDLMF